MKNPRLSLSEVFPEVSDAWPSSSYVAGLTVLIRLPSTVSPLELVSSSPFLTTWVSTPSFFTQTFRRLRTSFANVFPVVGFAVPVVAVVAPVPKSSRS